MPADEVDRQADLDALSLLDTPPEDAFDDVVQLASAICDSPIALFTLLDHDRQWFKSAIGLDYRQIAREAAFCGHAILQRTRAFVVEDALADHRFSNNPLVVGEARFRFYAGFPVATPTGHPVGTLCVFDRKPRTLTAFQEQSLRVLARQLEVQLALRAALRVQIDLAEEKRELTELIIHDLKSPLASIITNATFINEDPDATDDHKGAAVDTIAAARQMNRLVLDVLDTSLAGDSAMRVRPARVELQALLKRICQQATLRAKDRQCEVSVDDSAADMVVDTDADLLHRIVDNLVDNALKYGRQRDGRIVIGARRSGDCIVVTVSDDGAGISEADRHRIFVSGVRLCGGGQRNVRSSRGLGLRFCALAIAALGGRIWVEPNDPCGSVFCCSLPAT